VALERGPLSLVNTIEELLGRKSRHYATSWKVAGSIPDEFIECFYLPNHSNRTMILGFTQPLTQMSTRNLRGESEDRPARKADILTTLSVSRLFRNMGASFVSQPYGSPLPVKKIFFAWIFRASHYRLNCRRMFPAGQHNMP
jgi:hypothetical protein